MEIASIYKEVEFDQSKPVIKVLFETDFTKEIRIVMKAGVTMKKHQTSFPIVVELVEGEIDFGVNDDVLYLEKGDVIALKPSVPHDLVAKKDAIVRLTLAKYDKVDRVHKVVND